MAYVITDQKHIGFANEVSQVIVEIRCDTAADLPTAAANWLPGSLAWVIATGDFYGLSSSGTWVKQEA